MTEKVANTLYIMSVIGLFVMVYCLLQPVFFLVWFVLIPFLGFGISCFVPTKGSCNGMC